ncbi:MAG: COX15/CtaA family protein [Abditibacteriaceae bacterium]
MKARNFRYAAWSVLVLNLAVIAWGAYVRASFSGDGCGTHWPTCQGEVIPVGGATKVFVEFSHRASSGLALLCIVVLAFWAFYAFPRGHWARRGAVYSVIFIFTEALVGAGLVLFQLVTRNRSIYRALALSGHLLNTFILLAFLLATAWAAGSRFAEKSPLVNWRGQGVMGWILGIGLVLMLIAGVCGSIAALGDMLFPSANLAAGLKADFNPLSSMMIRLRWLHPVISVGTGVYLVWAGLYLKRLLPIAPVKQAAWTVIALVGVQIIAGVTNLLLLAPIPMQMLHLLLADLLWLALVRLALEVMHANNMKNKVELKTEISLDQKNQSAISAT